MSFRFPTLLLGTVLALGSTPGLAQDPSASSRISAVKLYPGMATVQRSLQLAPGAREAVFACLPAGLDAASLQVSAAAGVQLGELSVRELPRKLHGAACEHRLDARIRELEDRIATLRAEAAGIDYATGYFESFAQAGDEARATAPGQIPATAQALREAGQDALARRHELARQQEPLERQLQALQAERGPGGDADTLLARVQLSLSAPQGGELRLSYTVRGPGWQPSYRAALDSDTGRLRLERLAEVAQTSGEDWSEVPLTLSTGQPTAATQGPLPRPWRVGIQPPATADMAAAPQGRMMAAPAPMAAQALASGAPAFDVSVFDGAFATEFVVPRPVSVPSSGERMTLRLGEQQLDARLLVRSTPALDANAYLIARLDTPAGVWPSGAISLIRDGAYVGQGRFDAARIQRDGLSFGRDELVSVRSERPEQHQGKTGLIGSRQQRVDSRRYVVENRHRQAIDLQLLDAAPVSEHQDVRVESRYEPAPQTERWNEQPGSIAWEQSLAAGATQDFLAEHSISWPKDGRLRER